MKTPAIAEYASGMPEIDATISLSRTESRILGVVHSRWPTSSIEIAEFLGHEIHSRELKRQHSSRITYYLKKLVKQNRLMSKRVGNALIVWPYEVETFRVMKEILPYLSKEEKL